MFFLDVIDYTRPGFWYRPSKLTWLNAKFYGEANGIRFEAMQRS